MSDNPKQFWRRSVIITLLSAVAVTVLLQSLGSLAFFILYALLPLLFILLTMVFKWRWFTPVFLLEAVGLTRLFFGMGEGLFDFFVGWSLLLLGVLTFLWLMAARFLPSFFIFADRYSED